MTQPLTPQEVAAKMISLHDELSNFRVYLTMNSNLEPRKPYPRDDYAILHIQKLLRHEIRRIDLMGKRNELDNAITESLKRAGFEPDDKK